MPVAVITGAARGLGRHIAMALHECGYHVVINYLHSHKDAGELTGALGERAVAIRADVASLEQVQDMTEKIRDLWGSVDVLVNNAGVVRDGLLMGYQERDFDEVLAVNLKGCFNTVRTLAPLMEKSGGAHIVNISSRSGMKGRAGQAAYSAAKAGVIGFTLSAARELAEQNIMVNAVLPGYMPTDMGEGAEKAIKRATQESVLGTLAEPSETARFITMLVTAKNVSGQIFCLDSRI